MKTDVHSWQYLTEFFLEWKIIQQVLEKNQNTHFKFSNFFWKLSRLWDKVEKYSRDKKAKVDKMVYPFACWIIKATNTHSKYIILIVFPWQQWLHKHGSILSYM